MKKYKMDGLLGRTYRLVRTLSERKVSVYAANACFFLTLAVFPTLLLIPGVLRYTPFEAEALTRLLAGILPGAFLEKTRQLIRLNLATSLQTPQEA